MRCSSSAVYRTVRRAGPCQIASLRCHRHVRKIALASPKSLVALASHGPAAADLGRAGSASGAAGGAFTTGEQLRSAMGIASNAACGAEAGAARAAAAVLSSVSLTDAVRAAQVMEHVCRNGCVGHTSWLVALAAQAGGPGQQICGGYFAVSSVMLADLTLSAGRVTDWQWPSTWCRSSG